MEPNKDSVSTEMLGNKTKRDNCKNKNNKGTKLNSQVKNNTKFAKPFFPKTLYKHIKGVPPSPVWGNRFTSLIHNNKNLLYISNTNIICINLITKTFTQMLSSNLFSPKDKPSIIIEISNEICLIITEEGKFSHFEYNSNQYSEMTSFNNTYINLGIKKCKCALYFQFQSMLIASLFSFEKDNYLFFISVNNFSKTFEYNKICDIPYNNISITDMIQINEKNFAMSLSNSSIEIFQIDSATSINKVLSITGITAMIFNIAYCPNDNKLASIDKNGTVNIYELDLPQKKYSLYRTQKNKYNDKSILEQFLFFSLCAMEKSFIISSNSGRLFIYDYQKDTIEELSENPHTSSIYNIIKYNNFLCFVSSDHVISIYNSINLNFLFDVKTICYSPKALCVNKEEKKLVIGCQMDNQVYLYEYWLNKNRNDLYTKIKQIKLDNDNDRLIQIKYDYHNQHYALLSSKYIIVFDFDNENLVYKKQFKGEMRGMSFMVYQGKIYIGMNKGNVMIINYAVNKDNIVSISNQMSMLNQYVIINNQSMSEFLFSIIEFETKASLWIFNQLVSLKLIDFDISSNQKFIYDYESANENTIIIYYVNNKTSLNIVQLTLSKEIFEFFSLSTENYEKYLSSLEKIKEEINHKFIIQTKLYESISCTEITNIKYNKPNYLIASLGDGVINVYTINNNKTLILLHQIKAHFSLINSLELITTDKEPGKYQIISISNDHSCKLWNCNECLLLNIHFNSSDSLPSKSNDKFIPNYFTRITSLVLFQQTLLNSKLFVSEIEKYMNKVNEASLLSSIKENKIIFEDNTNSILEIMLFFYFKDEKLNLISVYSLIMYEYNAQNKEKSNINKIQAHFNVLLKKIKEKIKIELFEKIEEETIDNRNYLNELIQNKCYIESLLYCKAFNLGIDTYVLCIENIKRNIYSKQLFQVTKLQKVIELLSIYHHK